MRAFANRSSGDKVSLAYNGISNSNGAHSYKIQRKTIISGRDPPPNDNAALAPVPTALCLAWRAESFPGEFEITSINARRLVNKTVELEWLLLDHKPDVALVIETWLWDAILESEELPPGYRFVRKERVTRGGRVAVILSERLSFSLIENDFIIEMCCVNIYSFSPPVKIGAANRPHDLNVELMENQYDSVN